MLVLLRVLLCMPFCVKDLRGGHATPFNEPRSTRRKIQLPNINCVSADFAIYLLWQLLWLS
jgi:hypothetical protein